MNQFYLVLIGLFILAASFFAIGIYFYTRSKQKNTNRREKPTSLPVDEDLKKEGIVEVARLLRDESSGALLLEKGGVIYRKVADFSPEQRHLLSAAAADLQSFIGVESASPPEVTEPAPSSVAVGERESATPLVSRFKKTSQTSPQAQVKPPSMNPVDVFTRAISSDVTKVSTQSKSITAQIDEILQERLVNTPLEQRGIRLVDAPDGGVVVFVGIESYDGVKAVPDDEVQHAIRAAVAEWEKRNTQGR